MQPPPELLTRRAAVEYINAVLGYPLSYSTAMKLAAQRLFCEPARIWGRRPLYAIEDLRAWCEARSRRRERRETMAAAPSRRSRGGAESGAEAL
jgi:hypothetical protein